MNRIKKLLSIILSVSVVLSSIIIAIGIGIPSFALTDEEINAKNYPLPTGYKLKSVISTFDNFSGYTGDSRYTTERSVDEGTYYDGASYHYTGKQSYMEASTALNFKLDGVGFMFWYKCSKSTILRLRNQNNGIVYEANFPAAPEGKWVTYYYYGKCEGFTIKSGDKTNITDLLDSTTFTLKVMGTGITNSDSSTYVHFYMDEFITFYPPETPADTYNGEFLKYSLKSMKTNSSTNAVYSDDGSVVLSSATQNVTTTANITYNMNESATAEALSTAKASSGYLNFKLDNQGYYSSTTSDTVVPFDIKLNFTSIDEEGNEVTKTFKKYVPTLGEHEFLLNISDWDDFVPTTANIVISARTASGSSSKASNTAIKLYPITVYSHPSNAIVLQAEELNPVFSSSSTGYKEVSSLETANCTYQSADKTDFCVSMPSSSTQSGYTKFTLPNLTAGTYKLIARAFDTTNCGNFTVAVNNLNPVYGVSFKETESGYSSTPNSRFVEMCDITVTRNGDSVLRLQVTPKQNQLFRIDFFYLIKQADLEPEPASNYEIKPYPSMDNYQVKKVLATFDDYLCDTDDRYYKGIKTFGYCGDGNAFNINSRATFAQWLDNNTIVSASAGDFDGDGIRFWYKSSATAQLQFGISGSGIKYTFKLPANATGGWYTLYYTQLVKNGDLSNITYFAVKPDSKSFYIDEIHVIEQTVGDVIYAVNSDGKTASVVGYNLRLENVVINSEYEGLPVVAIADNALSGSRTLKTVTLPKSVKTIGKNAFANGLNLKYINLDNINVIDDSAFLNCEKLTGISFADNITSIADNAFNECDALQFIVKNNTYAKAYAIEHTIDYYCTTSQGIKYLRDYSANDSKIIVNVYEGTGSNVVVSQTIDGIAVVKVDKGAFENNEIIASVKLPLTVTEIGNNAFSNCVALTSVTAQGVETIGENAFANCLELRECVIGDNVTTIGDNAFKNDSNLERIYLGDSVTSIGVNTFSNSNPIAEMTHVTYESKSSYVYNYVNKYKLKYYPDFESEFVFYVIDKIAYIESYSGTSASVSIPDTIDTYPVYNIAEGAFKNNTSLKSITFGANVRIIEKDAFNSCSNLSSVTFDNGLRALHEYSFANCSSLLSVTVNDIVEINALAFYGSPTKINKLETDFIRSAFDYVNGMTAGINIGNTLESASSSKTYGTLTPEQSERLWGAPLISQELVSMIAEKFNTVRIPITWRAFINDNDGYKVDKAYMDRIEQVVEYCYNAGIKYIIINTHHEDWLTLDYTSVDEQAQLEKFKALWSQIAERFKNYDERLIFEPTNEARAIKSDDSADWYGHDEYYFTVLNNLHKGFYEVVRQSGGNNAKRYLLLQTYGGQKDARQIDRLWLPNTVEDNHIIASVHWYIESMTESHYTANLERYKSKFLDKGIPCVIGECGLPAWENYTDEFHAQWATLFFGLLERYEGLKGIIWEDHGNYTVSKRSSPCSWVYPQYVDAIKEATKKSLIDDDTEPVYGDVNGDGEVNALDRFTLTRHLAKWADYKTVNIKNSDVNCDGVINSLDRLILSKHLAGWIGYETLPYDMK